MLVESGAAIFATTISDVETAADKCEEMEEGYTQCSQFLYGRYIDRQSGNLKSRDNYVLIWYWLLFVSRRCTRKVGRDEQRFSVRSLGLHSPAGRWAVVQRGGRPHRAAPPWRHRDRLVVGAAQRPRGIHTQKPARGERTWDITAVIFSYMCAHMEPEPRHWLPQELDNSDQKKRNS